jgi:hypothetical protein
MPKWYGLQGLIIIIITSEKSHKPAEKLVLRHALPWHACLVCCSSRGCQLAGADATMRSVEAA